MSTDTHCRTGASAKVAGLEIALEVINIALVQQPERTVLQLARSAVSDVLSDARLRDKPLNIAKLAHLAGVSGETMRRRIHHLFPAAKVKGRFRVTREMLPVLVGDTNDRF